MDGIADSTGYLVSNPGMTIYAAIRGTKLYVATWTPTGGVNDHFILVSDTLLTSATTAAPWSKAGAIAVAGNKPFLAAESSNSYVGWFNAPADSQSARSSTAGGQMEGVIDLTEAFGSMPATIYIAALAYQTDDKSATDSTKGALAAQAPAGNGDGNVDPTEFLALPTAAIRDGAPNGTFDRLDPSRAFRVQKTSRASGGGFTVNWLVVPGQSYSVDYVSSLGGTWQSLTTVTAASGQDNISYTDTTATSAAKRFYRVRLLP
jgi:hypothetical protein